MMSLWPVTRRRGAVFCGAAFALFLVLSLTGKLRAWDYALSVSEAGNSLSSLTRPGPNSKGANGLPAHVDDYFEQAFSEDAPKPFPYAALKQACDVAKWPEPGEDEVYMQCGGMAAGLTSIVSQVKVCLKMAVETGSHLILPSMPLRDSTKLLEFNFLNQDAYLPYGDWFDAAHLKGVMSHACPRMRIIRPEDIGTTVVLKRRFLVSCEEAPGYVKFKSYFWVGRPFRTFFQDQMRKRAKLEEEVRQKAALDPTNPFASGGFGVVDGVTVVDVDSEFLLFRITDDPTRRELALWNDLSRAVRFGAVERELVGRLLQKLGRRGRTFYGVHYRTENDTTWHKPEEAERYLWLNLDALDQAWHKLGGTKGPKGGDRPIVYLACGDKEQVDKFVAAARARGWEVTHKWLLAQDDSETAAMIDGLAFDFQGAIDMGIMLKSHFFLGIQASAFSSTIANHRDITGRYRGSSLDVLDDEGARSHLFNDMDADEYACCL